MKNKEKTVREEELRWRESKERGTDRDRQRLGETDRDLERLRETGKDRERETKGDRELQRKIWSTRAGRMGCWWLY